MKKFFSVIIAGLMLIFGASCQQEEKIPLPVLPTDGNCIVRFGDQKYDLNIRFLGKDVERITVLSPENIKGIAFCREKESFTLSYENLICRRSEVPLPKDSMLCRTARAVRSLKSSPETLKPEKNDNGYVFSDSSYSLKTDNDGVISELIVGS